MPAMPTGTIPLLVSINGSEVRGLLHASISTRNCFSADSFSVTLAVGQFPLTDMEFWSSTSSTYVEMIASGESGPVSQYLITGLVDTVVLDPVLHTVSIEGRDLSSSLIDSYCQQDFVNQTASEIVGTIAQVHGLVPMVTATSDVVGRYYGDGYTRLSLGQFSRLRSDWDLVVQLARENSFDVFVQGKLLFFQPADVATLDLIQIDTSNVRELRVERALSITADPTARVQSWNSRNMASVESAGSGLEPLGGISGASCPGSFLFSASNLTSSQATGAAERYSAELNRLLAVLHLEMPWDLNFAPRRNILVSGTASSLDCVFKIESVERRYSSTAGSIQRIRAIKG
jgi:prophage tail gpP-like protein